MSKFTLTSNFSNNPQQRIDNFIKIYLLILNAIALQIFAPSVCPAQIRPDALALWLKVHKPAEFTGQVWARVSVTEPANYFYNVVIDSETNPYQPARFATGTVAKSGLKPKSWTDGENDWGKPLAWIPPTIDSDWIKSGEYSDWVKLPVSQAAQWHTAFFVKPKSETPPPTLRIEFASAPNAASIFHVVEEKPDDKLALVVRMPTVGGLDGLKMLASLTEWASGRREIVKSLKLSAPPVLNFLKIGTWASFGTYRTGGGSATPERAAIDFQNFNDLGINAVTPMDGLSDASFRELAQKYHITNTTLTAWANNWRYTGEAASGQYNFQTGETVEQHWTRVFDDYYGKYAGNVKANAPFAASIARHINLGDEIGAATNADEIIKTPQILAFFRDWLKRQNVTPAMLGVADWDAVQPTDDRAKLGAGGANYARRFYYTRRFINEYTAIYYRAATNAVEENFPRADLIAVNYQAGAMQFGFVGSDNDLDKGELDIFELGRTRALKGVMMEDWVDGWDLGVGRENLAAQMMRAAARKNNLPLAAYLVGGEAVRAEYFGYLMNGVREVGLYLYGPYSNIGPAWADDKNALAQIADVSRRVKKFESLIAKAAPRPAKVALLVATTSDVMQKDGLYFCPERQNLFVALQHAGVPVEVVSEQDILLEDRLKDYSMLVVSDPQTRGDVQLKIADWVKNGGRLWASVGALASDEFNQPSGALDKVFGVKDRKIIFQNGGLQPTESAWSSAVSKFNYQKIDSLKTSVSFFNKEIEIPVFGAKLQASPTTAQVIATYADGKPAVFLNQYGKGEAMLVGALLGEGYVRAHYPQNLVKDGVLQAGWKFESGAETARLATAFIDRAKIQNALALSVPGVYSSVMETPEATLVFLNNATGRPIPNITVRLRGAGKVSSVQSTLDDKIAYRVETGEAVFDVPLKDIEIVCLKH